MGHTGAAWKPNGTVDEAMYVEVLAIDPDIDLDIDPISTTMPRFWRYSRPFSLRS